MATRTFANLSRYEQAAAPGTAINPLDALLNGVQQGVQLQQLPQTLRNNALTQQLNNALTLQKLQDLANPQQALARKIQEELTVQGALKPNSGIVQAPAGLQGEIIENPQAINQTVASLNAALAGNPNTPIPSASPLQPETPISPFGVQTGININPNIPLQAEARALQGKIDVLNARPNRLALTKEGYIFNPITGELDRAYLPTDQNVDLEQKRKLEAEVAAKAKNDAAKSTLDSKQTFTAEQNRLNRENQRTLADLRASNKTTNLSSKQKDELGSYLASLEDLEDLKSEVVNLDKESGEPGFFQNALASVAANPSKGFWSSASRQLAQMGMNDSTIKKESARAGLEQAVKTALSGKTVSASENLTLTGLLPKADDTLAIMLIKLDGLENFLNNRIKGINSTQSLPSARAESNSKTTRMISPSGSEFDIPSENVDAAIKRGAKVK